MGIWGDAYGPEGSRQLGQASVFVPYTVSRGQPVSDGIVATYHLPLHWRFVQPSSNASIASLPRAQDHPLFYVGVYALIGLATGAVNVLSIIVMFTGALRASRLLFRRLLDGVVHATMRWHVRPFVLLTLSQFDKNTWSGHYSTRLDFFAVTWSINSNFCE